MGPSQTGTRFGMKYRVQLTDIAKKMLAEITDVRVKKKIAERIDKLTNSPDLQGKSLKGIFLGYRSIRAVGQRYRIVFKVIEQKLVVYIHRCGDT